MSSGEVGADIAPTPGKHSPTFEASASHPDHGRIVVQVVAPRDPDHPRAFEFRHNELVGTAARLAADAFGYTAGSPSFANDDNVVLDRDKSLAAEHVHDGDTLHLVDVGGGV
jgi:hypothetical protein